LEQFEKRLECEEKSKDLYAAGFLSYAGVSYDPSSDTTFIRSSCKAQMKKSVAYAVDIAANSFANILESQCECAAGMGPTAHCKHVLALFIGLCEFSVTRSLVTAETCTQQLQSFHKTKPYGGLPVKASALPL